MPGPLIQCVKPGFCLPANKIFLFGAGERRFKKTIGVVVARPNPPRMACEVNNFSKLANDGYAVVSTDPAGLLNICSNFLEHFEHASFDERWASEGRARPRSPLPSGKEQGLAARWMDAPQWRYGCSEDCKRAGPWVQTCCRPGTDLQALHEILPGHCTSSRDEQDRLKVPRWLRMLSPRHARTTAAQGGPRLVAGEHFRQPLAAEADESMLVADSGDSGVT